MAATGAYKMWARAGKGGRRGPRLRCAGRWGHRTACGARACGQRRVGEAQARHFGVRFSLDFFAFFTSDADDQRDGLMSLYRFTDDARGLIRARRTHRGVLDPRGIALACARRVAHDTARGWASRS